MPTSRAELESILFWYQQHHDSLHYFRRLIDSTFLSTLFLHIVLLRPGVQGFKCDGEVQWKCTPEKGEWQSIRHSQRDDSRQERCCDQRAAYRKQPEHAPASCMRWGYLCLFVSRLIPQVFGTAADEFNSLTWGVLQERITTTNYGTDSKREVFKYPVVMNTVQSTFAAIFGYLFVLATRKSPTDLPIIPNTRILWPLTLVAFTSALASPFGYASLQYVDYITFLLAKSCKLLPVMFLHVTLYRKKYPFQKYAVVALITAGVAIFTLQQPAGKKHKGAESSSVYGLVLLGINLLFDGLTNSTQDDIYASFRPYTGQQMMCALNVMSTILTSVYLLLLPYLAQSGIGAVVGLDLGKGAGELHAALAFIQRHPAVGWDILGFAASGALGQVFICKSQYNDVPISSLTLRSHDPVSLWQSALGWYYGHPKNADHDHLCGVVRPQLE